MDEVLRWVKRNLEDGVKEIELFLNYCKVSFQDRGFDIYEGGEGSPNPIYLQVLHRTPFDRMDFNDAMAYMEHKLMLEMKREILRAIRLSGSNANSITEGRP